MATLSLVLAFILRCIFKEAFSSEGLTVQQKPYSDTLCHMLPATRTLVLQVQVLGWDPWAGILGLGSLGSDQDICDGDLQLHGEKAFPAKTGSHEPGGEAASAVSRRRNHRGPWDRSFTWLSVPTGRSK